MGSRPCHPAPGWALIGRGGIAPPAVAKVIGLDTNLLLRLWLNDDPAQNRRIDKLPADHGGTPGSLLVTDVVLVEAVWTLRSAYRQDKAAQLLAVRIL